MKKKRTVKDLVCQPVKIPIFSLVRYSVSNSVSGSVWNSVYGSVWNSVSRSVEDFSRNKNL